MNEHRHNKKVITRSILLCVLLMISMLSFGQDDTYVDSVRLIDSILKRVHQGETSETSVETVEDEEADSTVIDDKFTLISSPGGGLDSYSARKADTRALQNDEEFWYANYKFKKKELAKSKSGQGVTIYQTFLWLIAIGGFIAFLIIYLSNSNVSLFRNSKTIKGEEEGDIETDDIFAINYAKEIDKAVSAGNFRLAVRLSFLQLLRSLSERHIIQYTHDKTNFDYLLQVHHAPWYQHFFRLTRNYEYVWYGQFDIDLEKYNTIHKDFNNFQQQLPPI